MASIVGTEKINPRHLREKFTGWDGKRVVVGTENDHYLCGTWMRIDAADVVFTVGGRELRVPLGTIDTVAEAYPWQADFFK